jgi:hypothetical protein
MFFNFCVDPTNFRCLERGGDVQGHSFLGQARKARWIHGRRYGIRPHAFVSAVWEFCWQKSVLLVAYLNALLCLLLQV